MADVDVKSRRQLGRLLRSTRLVTIADQVVSSLSNVLVAVAVAHSVSTSNYGLYAIAAGVYWVCLGSERALIGEMSLIFWHDLEPRYGRRTGGMFTASALMLGLVIGLPLIGVGAVLHEPAFWALGLFMPVLLWQDSLRYVMFTQKLPQFAFLSDCVWLAAVAISILLVSALNASVSLAEWLLLWALGAALAGIAVAIPRATFPSCHKIREAAGPLRVTALQLWGDFAISQGATQTIVLALPLVASLKLLGALKAAQVAFGPVNNALNAGILIAIPAAASLSRAKQYHDARLLGLKLGAAGMGIAAVYTAVLVVTPESVGHLFFSKTWSHASQLVVYVGLQYALGMLGTAALVILRGSREARTIIRARLVVAPLTLVFPLLGASLDGASGLGGGLVASSMLAAVTWWVCLTRTTHRRASATSDETPNRRSESPDLI